MNLILTIDNLDNHDNGYCILLYSVLGFLEGDALIKFRG